MATPFNVVGVTFMENPSMAQRYREFLHQVTHTYPVPYRYRTYLYCKYIRKNVKALAIHYGTYRSLPVTDII